MKRFRGTKLSARSLIFVVCLMGLMAGSWEAAAQATGSISGRVTDESGAGIFNIKVVVYDASDAFMGSVFTSAGGYYTASGLEAGNYKILFEPNGLNYPWEFYNNKISFFQADRIAVIEGYTTSNIDAQLITAGQISGRVTDEWGVGIPNIEVFACGRGAYYRYDDCAHSGYTNASGNYGS
ncbi:MAG: carboxypeptidase-like regulatory domain-containing protein [Deltaproteobacteria bacterium]